MLLSNPLLNDDRNLNTQGGLELSSPPVGLGNPLMNDNGGSPLAGLQAPVGLDSMEQFQQNIRSVYAPPAPTQAMPSQAQIFYSPSTGDIVVNGAEPFNEQNASMALASEQWANQPARRFTLPDTASDWREMPREEYAAYINSIRNPSFGRRMGEAWQHAWRGMGDTATGAALAINPEWEWAQTARENLRQEFINDAPFLMRLQDVENPGDALTYVSQMAVQGIPWLVETLVSMAAGALIGGAVSGGVGAPAGAVEGFLANQAIREATKRSITNVLRNNIARGARAYQQASAARVGAQQAATALTREEVADFAVRNSIASADDVNRFFNFGERAYHMARGGNRGAVVTMFGSNYMTGVGDIRNSIEDAGGDPQSADSVANIWGMALPYALLESAGDLVVTQPLTHIGPDLFSATARSSRLGDQLLARGANSARGIGLVGASEGLEEGGQYIVTQQGVANATNQPLDIEPMDLLENVVGGAIAGGALGGITYGFKRPEVRLEDGGLTTPDAATNLTPEGSGPILPFWGTQDTTVQGTDNPTPAYMGGLEPPDIDPAYGITPPLDTAGMISGQPVDQGPTAQEEREFLLRTLEDPNLTPEQYAAVVQAIDALEGGRDPNTEAADRYRAGANRGVLPQQPPMPEYQEPASTDFGPAYQRETDPQALDSSMLEPGNAVNAEAILEDIVAGKPVTRQQIEVLRNAVRERQMQDPTNPEYTDLINAINRVEAELDMDSYTEGTEAFKAKFPELNQRLETKALRGPEFSQSPMDAARPAEKAQPAKAKPIDNPIMEDGLPKYGPHRLKKPIGTNELRGRTEEPAAPIQTEQAEPDLIEQAKQLGKKEKTKSKTKSKRSAQRKKARALKRAEKEAASEAKIKELSERTKESDAKQKTGSISATVEGLSDRAAALKLGHGLNQDDVAEIRALEAKEALNDRQRKQLNAMRKIAGFEPLSEQEATPKPERESTPLSTSEKEELRKLDELIFALYRPDQISDEMLSRYNELARRASKDFFLAGRPMTRAELEREQNAIDRETDEDLDNSSYEEFLAESGEKPSNTELEKQYTKDMEEADKLRKRSKTKTEPRKRTAESNDLKEAASIKVEPVEATDERQDTAYKQGMRKYNDLYKFLQGARGKLGRSRKFSYEGKRDLPLPFTKETKWLEISGTALSYNELDALIERVRNEFTANEKTERSARVFHDYVNDAWQQNKTDPKHFAAFVEGSPEEVANWLNSEASKLLPPARAAAQKILASLGDKPVMAANTGRPDTGVVSRILRRVLAENPSFTFRPVHPAARAKAETIINEIHDAQERRGQNKSSIATLTNQLAQLRKEVSDKPVAASDEGIIRRAGLVTKREVKDMVSGVQKRIATEGKFMSTHVFEDVEDMLRRANDEMLIAPNGAKVNFGRFIMGMAVRKKMENPNVELTDMQWVRVVIDQDFDFRAGVLPMYDALIVFSNKLGSRRHALETLEHEWIVHKGLRAIFPNNEERLAFLYRMSLLPGMREKVKELVAKAPMYKYLNLLDQVEEVLAAHSETGLLGLEALLTAPEAIDPTTRRTLWEDFKAAVMDFYRRVFGDNRSDTDKALDDVIAALQRYAITGQKQDLNYIVFKQLTKNNLAAIAEQAAATPDDKIVKAASSLPSVTPAETYELLHGTGDNVGRPYSRREWQDDVLSEAMSDDSLMAKLDKIANGKVATPIKEGLKKIARELVTMNQMAMESPLVERMMEIMDNTIKRARFLMSTWTDARPYAHRDFLTTELTKRWGDKAPGATDKQRSTYGRMAIAATNHLLSKLSDAMVRAAPRLLVRHPDGTYTINHEVFAQYDDKGNLIGGLLHQGTLSKEAFANGLQQYTVDSEGETTNASVAKFTSEEIKSAYKIYLNETKLMAESALVTLEDATVMLSRKNDRAIKRLIKDNKFKESDQAFVNEALQRMYKLYADIAFHDYGNKDVTQKAAQADRARQVLAELMRSFWEKKKVADWTDSRMTRDDTAKSPRKNDAFKWREQIEPHDDVKPFVNQIRWFLEYDNTFGDNRLARINSLGVTDNRQYHMLSVFQRLLNSEVLAHEKENKVIQSILGNYVEMTRKGKWRVSLEVYEEDGKTKADISPLLLAKLPSIYAESRREANAIQADLAKEFGDRSYPVNNAAGDVVNVKFDIAVAMAPGQATMTDAPDIEGFLKVAELVGLKLGATQMKKITQLIANASIRKRYGLQRAGSPGMDADIIRNNSETMTQRAWEAAKTSQSYMLEEELADERLRYGDWDHLAELQRKFDIANRGAPEGAAPPVTFVRNPAAVIVAEQSLLRYANQLRHVARSTTKIPTVNIRTTKGELKLKITGEAEAYITHAKALRESLDKNQLELNLNDLISKTGSLRQIAVVSQLGTIAAGVMNAFTPITHLPARLMAFHNETGYGDGFGLSETVAEIASAMSQVMTVFKGYGDTVMLKDILDEARKGNNDTNLTLPELEAMYAETLNGVLTPTQTVSLTGGTESNLRRVLWRNIFNVFLKLFSSVEAATRRVAFLASYRLLKQRYIAAGVGTEEDFNTPGTEAYKKLVREVERIIKDSQGDYNNVNRPRAFRGDLAQYVLQYKMFPLMTVLLINNLPTAQKGVVLGTLFLLAGVKGEPFADDFMDIYDTVMQKLGLQHDSLELSMVQFFEDLLPGSSKWIMHGAIDNVADSFGWGGGTMSSRLAMGDIIPLTGLFRPEADVGREIVNAFGPAFAANMDILEYASILTDHALEFTGMRPRTSAWEDLIRKFPQGQVRGLGEAAIMGATGEISDPRGRLTSDEVNIYNIFMRALGFYPLEASKANDTVRLDRMHTGYMRNVRTRFVLAYARAYRADNEAEMERITDAVRDWNEAAELTGQDDMLIRNFRSAAIRAGRAASQTAVERTSSSAPDYSVIDELALATGADTETDE